MIWDSAPYKTELRLLAKEFAQWQKRKRLRSGDYVRIEMTAFTAAYLIRKLMDARKLTDRVRETRVRVSVAKCVESVTRLNWYKIDELYDFSTSQSKEVSIRYLCNQLIHSYVFVVALKESGGLSSLYFSSDEQRNKGLCQIDARRFEKLLNAVGRDNPNEGHWYFNPKTGDFETRIN